MTTFTTNNNNNSIIGLDIGTLSSKVVLGSSHSCEIVRSDSGNHTTPTRVGFASTTRQLGETAVSNKNAITQLNRLLVGQGNNNNNNNVLQDFYNFEVIESPTHGTEIAVDYNGNSQQFRASALMAMLLGKLNQNAQATMTRLQGTTGKNDHGSKKCQYVLAVPPSSNNDNASDDNQDYQPWMEAAYIAGLDTTDGNNCTALVTTPMAYAAAYQRKFPEFSGHLLLVDMGHAQTTASLLQFGAKSEEKMEVDGEENEKDNNDNDSKNAPPFTVVSTQTNANLGAGNVDVRLWHHFQSTLPLLSDLTPKSKGGQRLLVACGKLKQLLSQLPDASVTVENIQDRDVPLQASRTTLQEICQPEATALQALLESVLSLSPQIDAVEVVGGGCRIPFVQQVIEQTLQDKMKEVTLSRSLDDASAALGAALIGDMLQNGIGYVNQLLIPISNDHISEEDAAKRQLMRQAELEMQATDAQEHAKSHIKNQMEARVLELRSARHSNKHGSKLPSSDMLDPYLMEVEDWLFSEEADSATIETLEQKWSDMQTKLQDMCQDYYNAIQAEEAAKEQEMEQAAAQAALEKNGDDAEEDDHDNRRLPKKRRMEIVMKNKAEANELFKDGNWRFAAARYTKALTHCAKFVDLSPDDEVEVKELKVTLNLNLALAYSKLSNWDQALRVCNEALTLDDASAKAYYRRASVYYEKKRWDDAKSDVNKAKKAAPDDKAIAKLAERIDLQLKKQKQKEKKMAAKMFG